MLPELRKLISENQKLLYAIRKKGKKLERKDLREYLGENFKTTHLRIEELEKYNILFADFSLNPDIAYFAGFYVRENEIEIELVDFQLEPVLEKKAPNLSKTFTYENRPEALEIIIKVIEELSEIVNLEAAAIVFNSCIGYGEKRDMLYYVTGTKLKCSDFYWHLKQCLRLQEKRLTEVTNLDDVLAYTLYLREKVFESDSIVYYDLDQNRISYVKNDVLQQNSNAMFGMVFPRFTSEQENLFQTLRGMSGSEYEEMLLSKKDEVLSAFEQAYIQIQAFLNPEYFVIGGKWIKEEEFTRFFGRYTNLHSEYKELSSLLFSWPVIMNRDSHPQKGAGIYAAYSYFDWKLEW